MTFRQLFQTLLDNFVTLILLNNSYSIIGGLNLIQKLKSTQKSEWIKKKFVSSSILKV